MACSVGTRGANCEMQEREVAPGVLLLAAAAMLKMLNDAGRHVRSWGTLYSQNSTSLSLDAWDAVRSDSNVPTTNEVPQWSVRVKVYPIDWSLGPHMDHDRSAFNLHDLVASGVEREAP